jgi:hypothetical protein
VERVLQSMHECGAFCRHLLWLNVVRDRSYFVEKRPGYLQELRSRWGGASRLGMKRQEILRYSPDEQGEQGRKNGMSLFGRLLRLDWWL